VHWFARLEMRETLLRHGNLGPAPWISARPISSHPHRKSPNTPQLNTVVPRQRRDNLFEYGVDGPLSIARRRCGLAIAIRSISFALITGIPLLTKGSPAARRLVERVRLTV
jgi:hypothetical protein